MAYSRNNSGCGCIITMFVVMGIFSGIRSCTEGLINGDLKLPKFGSSRVGGGSGGTGTSNGYNVVYKNTTSPNYNSSTNDYTHTNDLPTEYREGRSEQDANSNSSTSTTFSTPTTSSPSTSTSNGINSSNSVFNSTPSSSATINTNSLKSQENKTYYKTCPLCNGKGKVNHTYWYHGVFGCFYCDKTEEHYHDILSTCSRCFGEGKILMTKTTTQFDEIDMPEW